MHSFSNRGLYGGCTIKMFTAFQELLSRLDLNISKIILQIERDKLLGRDTGTYFYIDEDTY